jgi:hypothetical protein
MPKTVTISSQEQFEQLLRSSKSVLVDCTCSPCHFIFLQLHVVYFSLVTLLTPCHSLGRLVYFFEMYWSFMLTFQGASHAKSFHLSLTSSPNNGHDRISSLSPRSTVMNSSSCVSSMEYQRECYGCVEQSNCLSVCLRSSCSKTARKPSG